MDEKRPRVRSRSDETKGAGSYGFRCGGGGRRGYLVPSLDMRRGLLPGLELIRKAPAPRLGDARAPQGRGMSGLWGDYQASGRDAHRSRAAADRRSVIREPSR